MTKSLFPREMGLKRRRCNSESQFKEYVRRIIGKASCYTSLYSFDRMEQDRPWRFDYTTANIDKAWWDFDSGEHSIESVKHDVAKLINRLVGDISLIATGRGFHVYQFFNKSVTGYEWRNHLNRYERDMAQGLTTLDCVGLPEKLVRIPNTFNPKRGRWAIPIDAREFAESPDTFVIPTKPQPHHFQQCPILHPRNTPESFDFIRWVYDNPPPQKGVNLGVFDGHISDISDIPIPPCISDATHRESPAHFARLALVQHLSEEFRMFASPDTVSNEQWDEIEDRIFNYIKGLGWRQFVPTKTRHGIRTNMKYKQSPTCKALASHNMCMGKCWRYDGTI